MSDFLYQPCTARLHYDGRYFTCAYCLRVREYPFFDHFYNVYGYAYCHYCGLWMKIENLEEIQERAQKMKGAE